MENESQIPGEFPAGVNQKNFLMEYKYFQSLCLMTRGVTHDYNNIFTGLSGQLNLLTHEAGAGAVEKNRVKLIGDLLARGVSRTSILYEFSRYLNVEKAYHSLDRILDLTVESLNTLSRSHTFLIEKHGKFPRLYCRMKDIVMLLFYLGENSFEAMPEGGTIIVQADLPHGLAEAIILSVRNRGKVSAAVRRSLFQPFVTTKTAQRGLPGLGLYAARNIAEDHGGSLFYSDDRNEETVFSVRLPVPETIEGKTPLSEKEIVVLTAPEAKKVKNKKEVFFVVEDDEAMRDVIVSILQRRGHVVFSAETCMEAEEDFELVHEAVTVLLIDVGLTDGDGFECLEKMLTISTQPKVIFMSGDNIDEPKYLKYKALFLKKPFTAKQIEDILNRDE